MNAMRYRKGWKCSRRGSSRVLLIIGVPGGRGGRPRETGSQGQSCDPKKTAAQRKETPDALRLNLQGSSKNGTEGGRRKGENRWAKVGKSLERKRKSAEQLQLVHATCRLSKIMIVSEEVPIRKADIPIRKKATCSQGEGRTASLERPITDQSPRLRRKEGKGIIAGNNRRIQQGHEPTASARGEEGKMGTGPRTDAVLWGYD